MTTPREITEIAEVMRVHCGGRCAKWASPCDFTCAELALRDYAALLSKTETAAAEDVRRFKAHCCVLMQADDSALPRGYCESEPAYQCPSGRVYCEQHRHIASARDDLLGKIKTGEVSVS